MRARALGVCLVLGVAGEADHQPAGTFGELVERFAVFAFGAFERDQPLVHALQLVRLVRAGRAARRRPRSAMSG